MQSFEENRLYEEKKKTSYKEQDKQKVEEYINKISAIPKDRLVYLDETGIDSYMYRPRAWSRKGRYIYEKISGRRYRRVGVVAALCEGNIVEPMQYDGTMDSRLFETWFQKLLCPAFTRGKVFIMDNAAFHRKKKLEGIAGSFGHQIIFLPPYSPELNPIEHFWAVLKKRLQNAMTYMSSLDDAIASCL